MDVMKYLGWFIGVIVWAVIVYLSWNDLSVARIAIIVSTLLMFVFGVCLDYYTKKIVNSGKK